VSGSGPAPDAAFDTGVTLAERMRRHAGDSTHLYGHLMRAMADDWEAGGPVRRICRGWEDAPVGSVVQLRLLAGLFRIVLTDRAPQLIGFYPCLGGSDDPAEAWPLVRPVLADHEEEIRRAMPQPPQTNEVGRSRALLVGMAEACRRSGLRDVRLWELGASAGLNLLLDRYRYLGPGWAWGDADSPVELVGGLDEVPDPGRITVVERSGCDLAPVDVSTAEGRLWLRSFGWPFHVERHRLLSRAFEVADRHRPHVDQAGAVEWLESRTAAPNPTNALTVVWHSFSRQYWTEADRARVDTALSAGFAGGAFAHVSVEYLPGDARPILRLDLGEGAEDIAEVGDHGDPVTLLG